MLTTYAPEAVLMAWQRLYQINLESWRPEVSDWLHSQEAEQDLRELLAMVPCSTTVH